LSHIPLKSTTKYPVCYKNTNCHKAKRVEIQPRKNNNDKATNNIDVIKNTIKEYKHLKEGII